MSTSSFPRSLAASLTLAMAAYFFTIPSGRAQNDTTTTATGGSATGGSATSGTVTGGSATGGSATGGSATATGGSATGGSASGGLATTSSTGGRATAGRSTAGKATATVDGREITASAETSVSIRATGSVARVYMDDHVLEIEKNGLVLDGKRIATMPSSAAKVQVTLAGGRLKVSTDGAEVISKKITQDGAD
jgi:hypothetical protein